MKKLILTSLLALITGCNKSEQNSLKFKFKQGDKCYIIVDNNPVVIQNQISGFSVPKYEAGYKDSDGDYTASVFSEYELTNKKE